MNTYCFRYETTFPGIKELVFAKYQAKNLSSALKLFWLQSRDFSLPVKRLSNLYEVTNNKGRCSLRLLKDNVKVYPNET